MSRKRIALLLLVLISLVLGLGIWMLIPKTQFINHPPPALSVDFEPFTHLGCPPNQYGFRWCPSDSPLAALGCNRIDEPTPFMGGLQPAYPIGTCVVHPYWWHTDTPGLANAKMLAEGQYFYNAGGIYPAYIRYVIIQDNTLRLIETEVEFREIYAPIDSPEEALSYVLATHDLYAYYGLAYEVGYHYEVEAIEDTHVMPIANGYQLLLYHSETFGCGPHWVNAVEVQIAVDGAIQEISRQRVFRDPALDEMCID